jgi:hypothetical protein
VADASHVDVNKVGGRVVTDAAAMQLESGVSKASSRKTGQADVDGFGLHVEAVHRDTGVSMTGAQELVGLRCAIAANHVDLAVGPVNRCKQIVQQVEDARVVVMNLAGAPVTQEIVEPLKSPRQVGVTAAINNVNVLVGMRVEEISLVLLLIRPGAHPASQFRNVRVVTFRALATCSCVRPSRRLACTISKPSRAGMDRALAGALNNCASRFALCLLTSETDFMKVLVRHEKLDAFLTRVLQGRF